MEICEFAKTFPAFFLSQKDPAAKGGGMKWKEN